MTRRALLIGSAVGDIQGIQNDLAGVAAMLGARAFEVQTLSGPGASRAGILTAYDELIRDTEEGRDDPVVIYYAGHGGLVINTDRAGEALLPHTFQCLIPTDYEQSTEADFRGISAFELSLLQAQLTEKTRNVTVIFDCCHAAQLSRGPQPRMLRAPRALIAPTRLGMTLHMQHLRDRYGPLLRRPVISNPHAVRIVASGVLDPAWPMQDENRRWYGAMTLALLRVLDEVGDAAVSWQSIIAAVRTRIRDHYPDQRPDVEGPMKRRAFSLDEIDEASVPIGHGPQGFTLGAGALGGVTVGDVYAAVRLDAPDHELARVRVTRATPLSAEATLIAWRPGVTALPPGAIAVSRELAIARKPVRVEAAHPEAAAVIEQAIARTRRLRVATKSEVSVIATLALSNAALEISDAEGPLRPGLAFPAHLREALTVAGHLAAARQLLELEGEHGVARSELDAEWGTVDRGAMAKQPDQGGSLRTSDKIYIRIKNAGSRALFAHVFNVGLTGQISLLSRFAVAGLPLRPREQVVLGESASRELVGLAVRWPRDLPRERPRIDTLLVIVTTAATDLRVLESSDPREVPRSNGSPLQQLLRQLHDGTTRSAEPSAAEPYLMLRYWFLLQPPASHGAAGRSTGSGPP
jgi:hypothetical protein